MGRSQMAPSGSSPCKSERGICKLCTVPCAGSSPGNVLQKPREQKREGQLCGSQGDLRASRTFEPGLTRRIKFCREGWAFHQRLSHADGSTGPCYSALPSTRGLVGLSMKSVFTGTLFTVSRNLRALGGAASPSEQGH